MSRSYRLQSTKKRIFLLLAIILFHSLPLFISAFYDKSLHSREVKLWEVRFWLWFFTWWSAWASLLTITWAIYKLFTLCKKNNSYGEQLGDIIITQTNLLSGVIFCAGGFFLTKPNKPTIIYPLAGEIKTVWVWGFYNFFWHILAPGLVLYFFWKYSWVGKLEKRKKTGLLVNLLNPSIYLFYNLLRPIVSTYYPKTPPPGQPHAYPSDYPYSPFFWISQKYANQTEQAAGKSKFLFWSWQPGRVSGLVWLAITVIFWYLVFSFLFWGLIKLKGRKVLWPFFVLVITIFAILFFASSQKGW